MGYDRIMFAGTGSGCGKTTITCSVMKALCHEKIPVIPFKCGPDYIDPMFHSFITGRDSTNLDSFFLDKTALCYLMKKKLEESVDTGDLSLADGLDGMEIRSGIGIVEGVMGFFDGMGMSPKASSFEIALWTQTPVILVINARGMALSVIALIQGYISMAKRLGGGNLIRGVILNQIGKGTCDFLRNTVEEQTGIKVVGYFPPQEEGMLKSRHLGLVTAAEVADLDERMNVLACQAASSIDLSLIRKLAASAPPLDPVEPDFERLIRGFTKKNPDPVRMAVARDHAFCFYYNTNLELLERLGVILVPFSPLSDDLPENIRGLYLGGGYPELYAHQLSKNTSLLKSIREEINLGLPVIAECGGFMYLHEAMEGFPMAGVIPGSCYMTKKLGPFGYVKVQSEKADVFGNKGTWFCAHEFHYSRSNAAGRDYSVSKANGRQWQEGYGTPEMYAGYPHLYFYSNVEAVIHLVTKMRRYI